MAYEGLEYRWPQARRGMVGSKNVRIMPKDSYVRVLNAAFDLGVISREGGSLKVTTTAITGTPKLRALLDWWPTGSLQRVLAVGTDGKTWRSTDGGVTFAELTAAGGAPATLVTTGIPSWVEGGGEVLANNRKAFLFNSENIVQVVSGDAATRSNIGANAPADWSGSNQPRFGFIHRKRMWAGLADRMYFSASSDHEDYRIASGGGSLLVGPGKGRFLQGGITFKGFLFAFKWPRGIWIVQDDVIVTDSWQVSEVTDAIGLAGPKAISAVGDGHEVLFLSEVGHLHLLSYLLEGDVASSDLMSQFELGPWVEENVEIDSEALKHSQIIYYPSRKEAHVTLRSKGGSLQDLRLVVDFNRPDEPRIRYSNKDVCEGLALKRNTKGIQRIISGDNAGRVWELDRAAKDKDGASYTSEFQTAHDDFHSLDETLASRSKNYQFLESVGQPIGNFDIFVDTIIDGGYNQTVAFNFGSPTNTLGSFVLGTDSLAAEFVSHSRRRLFGSGRYLSLVGRISGTGQDFQMSEFVIGFMPGPHPTNK